MEWMTLVFRTLLVYFLVFVTMRIMGKREIGKLSVFDLVISIMIAEIAVFVLEDLDKSLMEGFLPMLTLVIVQLLIAWLSLKSQWIRRWFDGSPSLLINNGKIDREKMKKQRYNLDDLLLQLRENKIVNVGDVEFAILETSGKLTVVEKPKEPKEAGPGEGQALVRYEGLPLPLIMDGKVQDINLEKLGKTRFWLKSQLRQKGIHDFKDVFLCTFDHRGRWFIDCKK